MLGFKLQINILVAVQFPLGLDKLLIQYKRILKTPGTVVLTACPPFTTDLINSNRKWCKYEIIWDKILVTNHANAKIMPMGKHENILIYYDKGKYNPQKRKIKPYNNKMRYNKNNNLGKFNDENIGCKSNGFGYPSSIIIFNNQKRSSMHSTQKPIALFEYLIKTYSDENDIVLDNTAGSGTTAIAAIRTNRNYILMEKEKEYYDIIIDRIEKEKDRTALFNNIVESEQMELSI